MKEIFRLSGIFLLLLIPVTNSSANIVDGKRDMSKIYTYISIYRDRHSGSYPASMGEISEDMVKNLGKYGYRDLKDFSTDLVNKDAQLNPRYSSQGFKNLVPYWVTGHRVDGSNVGILRRKGERDLLSYSDVYISDIISFQGGLKTTSPWGNWLLLWDDGNVESVPFDLAYFVGSFNGGFKNVFPDQAGVGLNCLSYSEFNESISNNFIPKPPKGTGNEVVVDNYGPEALVQLSRREGYPNRYGIDRDVMWKQFDPAQPEFTLQDVQAGATKLGLDTQVQKSPLSQLQQTGSPALLFLKDDGRIVTLTALDDDRAVVVDRGLTRNVERSVLEARYSGEALVPTKALTQNTGIVADDAVRSVQLPSLDAEVPQTFTLRNTGKAPLTLQLEYPLLGVTESKLSKDTLAPGETATLDLKVKWRSILKAPYQNVLVSIQTNDPIVPRLQLAILLNPPKTAEAK